MPPRSFLYHLEPIGIATDYTESFTSYIYRIAEAHSVRPGKLLASLIIPNIDKEYMLSRSSPYSGTSFNNSLRSSVRKLNRINGLSNLAIKLVDAMKALVMRDDLELLTMLTWSNVITSRNLLRDLAAWCPFCFQEWKSKGQTIYSPLIWNLNIVKICKYHNTYCNYSAL